LLIGVLAPSRAAPGRLELEVREVPLQSTDAAMTQCVAQALGASIARLPAHWLWMARPPVAIPSGARGAEGRHIASVSTGGVDFSSR
jgi:hypothetical protein